MFVTFPIVFQICDINAYFNHTLSKSNMCKTEQISRKTVFFVCDFCVIHHVLRVETERALSAIE